MSIHLLECAAQLKLQPSTKLALMAFADSADRHTHVAFPGLDQVQTWANVGRSRAAEIVAELVDLGLLHRHKAGHRGRRAEYVVFPNGCCEAHQRPGVQDVVDVEFSTEKGSGGPESLSVNGSALPDPFGPGVHTPIHNHPERVQSAGGFTQKGSGLGPVGRTPSLTTTTSPLTPASGGIGCPKHKSAAGANCRACGTTPRQLADADAKARKDAARKAEQSRLAAAAAQRAAAKVRFDQSTAATTGLIDAVRDSIADAKAHRSANRKGA